MTGPTDGPEAAQGPPLKLSAKELRILAETADGWRDEGGHIVARNGRAGWLRRGETGGVPLLEITPSGEVNNRKNFKILTEPVLRPEVDIRNTFDAIFWTGSALRKFAFPYYAGYEDSGKKVDEIIEMFGRKIVSLDGAAEGEVVAIAHSPSSDPTSLETSLVAIVKVGEGIEEHLQAIPAVSLHR